MADIGGLRGVDIDRAEAAHRVEVQKARRLGHHPYHLRKRVEQIRRRSAVNEADIGDGRSADKCCLTS